MSTGTELRAVFYARVSTEEEKQLNVLEKQIHENKDVIRDICSTCLYCVCLQTCFSAYFCL